MAKKTTTPARKKTSAPADNKKKNVNNAQSLAIAMLTGFIVSILLVIFMYIDSSGIVNGAVKNFLKGLFGNIAYAIPLASIGLSAYLVTRQNLHRFRTKFLLMFLVLWNISAITHLISHETGSSVLDAYNAGIESNGGGFLGAIAAYGLQVLFNDIAAFVVLLFILFILLSIFTRVSLFSAIFSFFKGVFTDIKDDTDNIQTVDNSEKAVNIKRKIKKSAAAQNNNATDVLDIPLESPESIIIPDVSDNCFIPEVSPKNVEIEHVSIPIDDNSDNDTDEASEPFDFNLDDLEIFDAAANGNDIGNNDDYTAEDEVSFEASDTASSPISEAIEPAKEVTEEEQQALNDEIETALETPKIYVFPSLDFLAAPTSQSTDTREEMRETAAKLIQTLKSFHVEAKLLQVTKGPSVTRYEIQIEAGTKFAKVESLSKDIALNLAAQNILIAPVPDKAAIGIEVPNKEVSSVYLRELIESDKFTNAKSKLTFALGKDIAGNVIVGDIAKMPHILIAGTTGSGKSVCTNTIITSFLYKARPDEVKLIMIDPKKVEFIKYDGIPHLLIPVVTDPKRAAAALNWATQEMDKRYNMFTEEGVKNIETYNSVMDKIGGKRMPQIVIIIDELADLMMAAAKEVESCIVRLTQLARAAGIHLIIATQRPSVNVVTGLIKANMPSRIALFLSSQVDSRTILDRGGAEKLLGNGDMLYSPVGSRSPLRVQGAYISDEEIEKIVGFLKETSEQDSYSADLTEHIERRVTPDEEDDGDALLPQAIELAMSMGQISTSMVQRKFRIGYARAGRIIDQMENRGIISGPNGSKPREVIVGHMDLSE